MMQQQNKLIWDIIIGCAEMITAVLCAHTHHYEVIYRLLGGCGGCERGQCLFESVQGSGNLELQLS